MNANYPVIPVQAWASRALGEIRNLISLLVFFGATALLFRSYEFALIVTASLGFHELGHASLLAHFRTNWRISFGIVGAYTWSPAAQRNRLSNLVNSVIHMGGPLFSVLLALAALVLARVFPFDEYRLLLLANFSAQLGLLNLLPLGSLSDGGKVVRRVIAPLGGSSRTWAAILPLTIAVVMLGLFTVFDRSAHYGAQSSTFWIGMLLMAVWMTSSLLLESQKRDRIVPPSGEPVTAMQGYLLLALQWSLLVMALVITAVTPFWLAPEYVMGSLANFLQVMHLFMPGIL